jgi:hypothetical protein
VTNVELALVRIRDILADDKNYPSDALKLGGIWNYCDWAAEYRRFESTDGPAIEVIERSRTAQRRGDER